MTPYITSTFKTLLQFKIIYMHPFIQIFIQQILIELLLCVRY